MHISYWKQWKKNRNAHFHWNSYENTCVSSSPMPQANDGKWWWCPLHHQRRSAAVADDDINDYDYCVRYGSLFICPYIYFPQRFFIFFLSFLFLFSLDSLSNLQWKMKVAIQLVEMARRLWLWLAVDQTTDTYHFFFFLRSSDIRVYFHHQHFFIKEFLWYN